MSLFYSPKKHVPMDQAFVVGYLVPWLPVRRQVRSTNKFL